MNSDEVFTSTHLDQTSRRFAVAWRNRSRPLIAPVGVLDYDGMGYRFQYLGAVGATVDGFRPLIGFPDLDKVYESSRLWPFFNLRIMDRKRPDFAQYTHWLGLEEDASRLDILSHSGGEQKGDSVSLTEAPRIAGDGTTTATFLLRGASHAVRAYDTGTAAESLRAGDELVLVDDVENEANKNALLFKMQDGSPVGWVPDLLIAYARQVRSAGGLVEVLQNNGPESPWHMRLLVRLSGRVTPGTSVFFGDAWPPDRGYPLHSQTVHSGAAGETERLRNQRLG